ncbi:hypothetical protein MtrunA17_Chr4g0008731 [Medicago truncatula]|uniref:Plant/T7H20-70 protein n=1 Tax=Medicago truncatula TaxID=3880 RepID=A0A072UIR5_MEDTR|nr:uncharacterized protein LOC25491528 [Medicago truncatula]KEH28973.1 plant/T7H20-70 protein [Medicago truncatula]RHN59016.1 hypothetical protein MtrunA17_Chr4g0008731 [Medicago truncatula]
MEGKNKQKGISSSPCSELFGSKQCHSSSSSSPGIYGSIFSTQSPKILGRQSVRSEVSSKTTNDTLNTKTVTQESIFKDNGGEAHKTKKTDMSWLYKGQRAHPCHLSSSIYYGGQDIYPIPQSTQNAAFNSKHKNPGGEDDSHMATRGDWWQGSLYY